MSKISEIQDRSKPINKPKPYKGDTDYFYWEGGDKPSKMKLTIGSNQKTEIAPKSIFSIKQMSEDGVITDYEINYFIKNILGKGMVFPVDPKIGETSYATLYPNIIPARIIKVNS